MVRPDRMETGMSGTAAVETERQGEVATLWLARPERGNALGAEMVEALEAALDATIADGARR